MEEVLIDKKTGEAEYRCKWCQKWTTNICQAIALCSARCYQKYWEGKNDYTS